MEFDENAWSHLISLARRSRVRILLVDELGFRLMSQKLRINNLLNEVRNGRDCLKFTDKQPKVFPS